MSSIARPATPRGLSPLVIACLASSYAFVNPLIALLLGVTLGAEVVSGYEWLAAAVVLTGVVLLLAGRKPAG